MPSPPLPTARKPIVLCPYHYWNGESHAGFQAHAAGDLPASAKRPVFSAAQLLLQAPGSYPWLRLQNSLELVTLTQKLRHRLTTVQFWLIQCLPHSLKSKTPTEEPSQKFLTFFGKRGSLKGRHVFWCLCHAPGLLHTFDLVWLRSK